MYVNLVSLLSFCIHIIIRQWNVYRNFEGQLPDNFKEVGGCISTGFSETF